MSRHALVIVAHPSPHSLSHAMSREAVALLAEQGYEVLWHDLHAEGFDPVQPTGEAGNRDSSDELVEAHCRDLAVADLVLVFHPNWWGQPPAILKGWIDRCFRPGLAYDYPPGVCPEGEPVGLLRARVALVFNTSNTPWAREVAVFGNPLEGLWKHCVFGLCGVPGFERRVFGPVSSSTPELRASWLAEVRATVERHL
ncbi:NAD(P)H-dependent oxidoreductase [Aquabacterium sp. A7-Y]|uniref:NAD(P)H-dependent oxidoreductase n=1 Tax=Aquabacterium sp. A7-Y TaxID=1349605 RepID=UPI00223E778A|nr:NAD(P)H-dependent oxidoreductase [Aquabacterium sp. A7-Y]MCW7538671.1 NAD(P)H-dependent oxidoreductase [Aquabacterium sp. A7-Y]